MELPERYVGSIPRVGLVAGAVLNVLILAWRPASATPTPTPMVTEPSTPSPSETPTPPVTMYGTLNNFDVFNDTGQECHGFEIELDGLSSQDVVYTFGDPYERYGNPKVVDFSGGVYVRYESPYDSANNLFTQTTPLAPSVITPTDGHACWTGGSADYATSGCEHFGVSLTRDPTATVYRWLVADSLNPGALQPSGTKVSIPAPVWHVVQPTPGAVNPAPVVRAVIEGEPPEPGFEFGDAMWVKVFKTESPEPAELHHLVTDDPVVPQEPSETEVEWTLLQANAAGAGDLENEAQIGAGNESVTRRYEFYEYTGAYDPENHEALPISDQTPDPHDIGNYIGAQIAAVNLAPAQQTPLPSATPSETPTSPVTPTSTARPCVGDCGSDGQVTVDEILTMVNVALSTVAVSACDRGDQNHDGTITIDEILTAVNNALQSCG